MIIKKPFTIANVPTGKKGNSKWHFILLDNYCVSSDNIALRIVVICKSNLEFL